jgi:antitoxin component YwqK of YwqJK toxin-antitoxin module
MESEGTYANDELQGEVIYYNADGTLKEKKNFSNGVEQLQ